MVDLVYFSSTSENTRRFVDKLGLVAHRIPVLRTDAPLIVSAPYVLVTPTYGAGKDAGAVPKQVIRFLNDPDNRKHIIGVIAGGNTNFGATYCLAGNIIARKCDVPVLYRFEITGTPDDVTAVQHALETI